MRGRIGTLALIVGLMAFAPMSAQESEIPLFNPQRTTLYTQPELWRGFDAVAAKPGWDADVYRQYVRAGKFYPMPGMARARSLHDDGISTALGVSIRALQARGKAVVAVMGNAAEDLRCSATYRQTALLGYQLARSGYLVTTGGGPGEMEAANLGAYLSGEPESAIDAAIAILRAGAVRASDPTVCRYTSYFTYTQAAFDVVKRFPNAAENLGVPTWFYGHEPPNIFATQVAKFFSNAIREDTLLAIATAGVVYTEGAAGMRQEIFQKAAQNHFASFCYVSPMVFLGTKEFGDSGLYQLVYNFAAPAFPSVGSYRDFLKLTGNVADAVAFLKANPPRRINDAEATCANAP